jgi:ribosome-binding protein aMBF1 (putative translation factor)
MNKKHFGSSYFELEKELEKKYPDLRANVNKLVAKAIMAGLLKTARMKKGLSQSELAEKAGVAQSVIARIEAPSNKTIPGLGVYSDILSALGYNVVLSLEKTEKTFKKAA